jgi:uncharacterized protein YkwD
LTRSCNHQYEHTQGFFLCSKCGNKQYGRDYRKKKHRIIGLAFFIIVFGFFGMFLYAYPEAIAQTLNIVNEQLEGFGNSEFSHTFSEYMDEISKPEQTTEKESLDAISYINEIRIKNGKSAITWDPRVYNLGLAWTSIMYEEGFLDHTNPITKQCAASMKSGFGLKNNEYVAENLIGKKVGVDDYYGSDIDIEDAVESWLSSRGHRYNLLYDDHVAGAYVCTGGACSFLGLNYERFGDGCNTAKEGMESWYNKPRQSGELAYDELK